MVTYIFLDDLRSPPSDGNKWILTKDIDTAYRLMVEAWYVRDEEIILSLDHDLGDNIPTGYDLVKRIESAVAHNEDFRPKLTMRIHSANPVGIQNMERGIQSIYRFLGVSNV